MTVADLCCAQVPFGVIRAVASKEDTGKWDTYWLRSFVEENRKMSWWVRWMREPAGWC
jgi:hypothetical protein